LFIGGLQILDYTFRSYQPFGTFALGYLGGKRETVKNVHYVNLSLYLERLNCKVPSEVRKTNLLFRALPQIVKYLHFINISPFLGYQVNKL
jgi:hypothetical protein